MATVNQAEHRRRKGWLREGRREDGWVVELLILAPDGVNTVEQLFGVQLRHHSPNNGVRLSPGAE